MLFDQLWTNNSIIEPETFIPQILTQNYMSTVIKHYINLKLSTRV